MSLYDQENTFLYFQSVRASSFLNSVGRFFATMIGRGWPSSLTSTSSCLAVLTRCDTTKSFSRASRALSSSCSARSCQTSVWYDLASSAMFILYRGRISAWSGKYCSASSCVNPSNMFTLSVHIDNKGLAGPWPASF